MPRFFIKDDNIGNNGTVTLTGDSAAHISRSLRMRVGDSLTVCDYFNYEYDCVISAFTSDSVTLDVISRHPSQNEPTVKVSVYQALPKSSKLELIIQKCVELGAYEIVPVLSSRCISRPDEKSSEKKTKRRNAISEEAAKQSGRGRIPEVLETMRFSDALTRMKHADICFMCYEETEAEGFDLKSYLQKNCTGNIRSVAFFVGPEGGISHEEAALAKEQGIACVSLGKRILRTETAPMCVMSCIMYETNNMK